MPIDPKLQRVAALKYDFELFAKTILKIKLKDGTIVPFKLNTAQRKLHKMIEEHKAKNGNVRLIIPKARRMGISTYVEARYYWKSYFSQRALTTFIMTHKSDSTEELFSMVKTFHMLDDTDIRPALEKANAKTLAFRDNYSKYNLATAGSVDIGRGMTITHLHASEVAYWPDADNHVAASQQAVGDVPGTEIILESTADGISNLFYRYTMAAERGDIGFQVFFMPWFWMEEYSTTPPLEWAKMIQEAKTLPEWNEYGFVNGLSIPQLYWAYCKNRELAISVGEGIDRPSWKFKQEYPSNLLEAFQSSGSNTFIPASHVLRARKPTANVVGYGKIILGIDPALGGATEDADGKTIADADRKGDKVGVIDRCGSRLGQHVCKRLDGQGSLSHLANQIVQIINEVQPDEINIDTTGLGRGLYDILVYERGFRNINAIGFANKAYTRSDSGGIVYANKRAEMWDHLRQWLNNEVEVQIPDDDGLQADLCGPVWQPYQPNGSMILESKDKIKKRLGYSPDLGDAAALTFANPQVARVFDNKATSQRRVGSKVTGY